jgi:hypothetical protein
VGQAEGLRLIGTIPALLRHDTIMP